jgi:O-6-methylguanine DNA methyltransferase
VFVSDDAAVNRWAGATEFRAAFTRVFGDAACGADPDSITLAWLDSPVGPLLVGASAQAVVLLEFTSPAGVEAQLRSVQRRHSAVITAGSNALTESLRLQLAEYFAGQRREFTLPLEYPGTAFQRRVWSMLLTIPYGSTWSYLDVATRLGDPAATRAVGTANGTNHIAIIIPCHRVVNASGALGGYGGGLWRKQLLLDLESGQGRLMV